MFKNTFSEIFTFKEVILLVKLRLIYEEKLPKFMRKIYSSLEKRLIV